MNVTSTRYEGTKYCLDIPGNKYNRGIATARQEECHILQIRPDMPIEISCVEWLCLANAEFAPYLPYYAVAMTDTPEVCKVDSVEYSPYSMYWSNRSLATVSAQNRSVFGNKIKAFYDEYENNVIENLAINDKEMLNSKTKSHTANVLARNVTYDAYNKSQTLFSELIKFMATYEGEDETKGNNPQFEIKLKPTVERIPSYVTNAPTVVTE